MIASARSISTYSGGSLYRSVLHTNRSRRYLINGLTSQFSSFSHQTTSSENIDKFVRNTEEGLSLHIKDHIGIEGHHNRFIDNSINENKFLSHHAASDLSFHLPPAIPETSCDSPLINTTREEGLLENIETSQGTIASSKTPDFSDPSLTYGSKSTAEILSSLFILRLCQVKPIVQNAERIISLSRRLLGPTVTDAVIRHTFFKQFCGGEDAESIRPTIERLENNGIGSILDYAAERDLEASDDGPFSNEVPIQPENQPARIYDYKSEELCDHHLEVFRTCVHAVRDATPNGFAAIKITALGNPLLLERLSIAIIEAKKLFSKFDKHGRGVLSLEEFAKGYREFFNDANEKLPSLLERLDPQGVGEIDYIEWSKLLSPVDLPRIVSKCRSQGPLYCAAPSAEEVDLMLAMQKRAYELAEEAFANNVRLLIDAEQTRYQPAIDNIVLDLQQKFNAVEKTDIPIIFNTYQAYLKDTSDRIRLDLKRSERYNYHFAAKLVRGAYMVGERALAAEKGYPSPIHDTITDTHQCYDECLEHLLHYYAKHQNTKLELMVATHNQASIEKTIALMNEFNISQNEPVVHFAQLYGMSDNLTYPLGKHNHRAFKYLPYGSVNEVIPYLVRRGQENSDVFGNANFEMGMMKQELKRRIGLSER